MPSKAVDAVQTSVGTMKQFIVIDCACILIHEIVPRHLCTDVVGEMRPFAARIWRAGKETCIGQADVK